VFQQANYLENFVQATFDALPAESLTGERSAHLFGNA
jgi:phosphoglucomutase